MKIIKFIPILVAAIAFTGCSPDSLVGSQSEEIAIAQLGGDSHNASGDSHNASGDSHNASGDSHN